MDLPCRLARRLEQSVNMHSQSPHGTHLRPFSKLPSKPLVYRGQSCACLMSRDVNSHLRYSRPWHIVAEVPRSPQATLAPLKGAMSRTARRLALFTDLVDSRDKETRAAMHKNGRSWKYTMHDRMQHMHIYKSETWQDSKPTRR